MDQPQAPDGKPALSVRLRRFDGAVAPPEPVARSLRREVSFAGRPDGWIGVGEFRLRQPLPHPEQRRDLVGQDRSGTPLRVCRCRAGATARAGAEPADSWFTAPTRMAPSVVGASVQVNAVFAANGHGSLEGWRQGCFPDAVLESARARPVQAGGAHSGRRAGGRDRRVEHGPTRDNGTVT